MLDRSPIDILAYTETPFERLSQEIEEMKNDKSYAKIVFLLEHNKVIAKTAYRHENFEEAVNLEQKQIENYTKYGFKVLKIPFTAIETRSQWIVNYMNEYLEENANLVSINDVV